MGEDDEGTLGVCDAAEDGWVMQAHDRAVQSEHREMTGRAVDLHGVDEEQVWIILLHCGELQAVPWTPMFRQTDTVKTHPSGRHGQVGNRQSTIRAPARGVHVEIENHWPLEFLVCCSTRTCGS